jgi:hypothetical protein
MKTSVNFYTPDGATIIKTREYASRALALAACKRAAQRHVIAVIAGIRTADDPPTVHS